MKREKTVAIRLMRGSDKEIGVGLRERGFTASGSRVDVDGFRDGAKVVPSDSRVWRRGAVA